MQNRFKFRVWDKENKCLHYSTRYSNFTIVNGTVVKVESYPIANSAYLGKRIAWEFDDAVIMQCTGLKDKNNKLIYEGDIVKTYLHEVKYVCAFLPIFGGLGLISNQDLKDYEFCKENWESFTINDKVRKLDNRFKLANQGNSLRCFNMNDLKMCGFEVIGNIYENPELLSEVE